MNKARLSLVSFNVATWVVLIVLLIAGQWNRYVYFYGSLVLLCTCAALYPWRERTTIKAEGGFLGGDNEIDEKVIHDLAEQSERELEG